MVFKDLSTVRKDDGCAATNWLWRISMVIAILGFAVYVVGFSTNYWLELDDEPSLQLFAENGTYYDKHSGLWRRCFSYMNATTDEEISGYCEDIGNSHGYRVASKIMCTAGLIVTLVGLIGSLTSGFFNSAKLLGVAGFLVVSGGLVAGIGSAVLVGKSLDDDDDVDPGYSAYFALIGNAVVIIAGFLLLCSIRSGYNSIA